MHAADIPAKLRTIAAERAEIEGELSCLHGIEYGGMPHGSGHSDTTADIAERADALGYLDRLRMLDVQEAVLRGDLARILDQIILLEDSDPEELYTSTLLDMRVPGKVEGEKRDGAQQNMGMYSKESAFTRKMHLQEALNKIQGRIATVIGKIQQAEENEARIKLERERLELLRLRATGRVEVEDDDEEGADDDSLHK